jgi:hypothetical protein
MPGTVVTDLTFLSGATTGNSSCDSLTDWTGTGLAVDTVQFVQGTGSIWSYAAGASTVRYWTFSCVSTNLQNKVIYLWFALGKVAWLNTKANGGLSIQVGDGTNYYEWYFAGSDTLPHNGFICHAIHTGTTPNNIVGSPNLAAVTKITVVARGSFPGKAYLWLDAIRVGTYIGVYGGTETSPATFDDIASADVSNAYGVFRSSEGAYLAQIPIIIGKTDAATYFKDTNKVIFFKDALVPADFYKIQFVGSPSYSTYIYFGEKVGGRGTSGIVVRSVGSAKYKLIATDTNVTGFGIYGSLFYDAYSVDLQPYSTSKEVLDTVFTASGLVKIEETRVEQCQFISADDIAVRIDDTNFKMTDSIFINNPRAIEFTVPGSFTFEAIKCYGNIYDFRNSSGGTITIYADSECVLDASKQENPYGGTVDVILSAIHKLSGLKEGSEVTYVDTSTGEVVFHVEDVDASGETTYSYNASVPRTVDILIHHVNYVPIVIPSVYLGAGGGSIPVTQYWDRVYANP